MGLLFPSCARTAPPERAPSTAPVPEVFSGDYVGVESPARWWETFNAPALNDLVESALSENFTIAQAVARVRQAGALLRQSEANRGLEVDFGADTSIARRESDIGGGETGLEAATRRLNALNAILGAPAGAGAGLLPAVQAVQQARDGAGALGASGSPSTLTSDVDEYGLRLTARYEVDIWGRLRAAESAASAAYGATREETRAIAQSVAGQVVLTWLDLLQYGQILEVVRGQLETNKTNLELIELRYRNGLSSTLDVYQQRQAVAETEAVIPPLEARFEVLKHTLAILLGKPPRTALNLGEMAFRDPGALPETGLPADLLSNRPDIRAAGLRLQAADWRVAVAEADRLPRLQLTAGLGTDSESLGLLFDNWFAQLAAGLTGPVFDAGRRQAEVDRARAEADERLGAYKEVVIAAVAEVEDALVLLDRQEAFIKALHAQLEAAGNSHREALGRYRRGLSDYLDVLTALRNMQVLERDVVEAEHDRLVYRVQLHLALGGGWMAPSGASAEGPIP